MATISLNNKKWSQIKKENKEFRFFSLKAHLHVELDQAKFKLLVFLFVLLLNGFSTLFSDLFMKEIFKMQGIDLPNLPDPSLLGFLEKFFGSIDAYLIIIILLGMGTFSNELEINKQVYFTLARPVSRSTYYFTRALILVLGYGLVYLIGSSFIYAYSLLFFESIPLERVLLILIINALQFTGFFAIIIMVSSKFNQLTTGILGFLVYLVEYVLTLFDPLKWFSLIALDSYWTNIFTKSENFIDLTGTIVALVLWTILPIMVGWYFYKKRDL